MKTIKYIIGGLSVIFLTFGCENEMMDFQGTNSIYFEMQIPTPTGSGIWPYVDTSTVKFAATVNDDSIPNIKFKLYGKLVDYDRKINIRIAESSTAVLNREYEIFPTTIILPAGKEFCYLPIKFMRSDSIFNDHKYLTLELIETEDFKIDIRYYKSKNFTTLITRNVDVWRHTIDINDALSEPITWKDIRLGTYSDYKFRLLNETFGLTPEDWSDMKLMPDNKIKYIAKTFKAYLIAQEAAGTPLYELDKNGEIVYQKDANGQYVLDSKGNKIPVKLEMGTTV